MDTISYIKKIHKNKVLRGKAMSIRNENYDWKDESLKCTKEIREALLPIFKNYGDKFSSEDLYYLICTEANSIITREVLKKKVKK